VSISLSQELTVEEKDTVSKDRPHSPFVEDL